MMNSGIKSARSAFVACERDEFRSIRTETVFWQPRAVQVPSGFLFDCVEGGRGVGLGCRTQCEGADASLTDKAKNKTTFKIRNELTHKTSQLTKPRQFHASVVLGAV
jgi:hypothetical protein